MALVPSTSVEVQVGVAVAGLVDFASIPPLSVATHSEVAGHATALRPFPVSVPVAVQVGVAAVRTVEVTTSPPLSTATHKAVEAHETPASETGDEELTFFSVQVGVAA